MNNHYDISEVCEKVQLTRTRNLVPATILFTGMNTLELAEYNDLTYVSSEKQIPLVKDTDAYGIVIAEPMYNKYKDILPKYKEYLLSTDDMFLVKNKLISLFQRALVVDWTKEIDHHNIFNGATISPNAYVHESATIFPGVVVMSGARIGSDTTIYPNAVIGPNTYIGDDCIIGANCTIGMNPMVYNSNHNGEYENLTCIGNVVIKDNVELGSGVNIDPAIIGHTKIGEGTKIGSHVHIGHDCQIGKNNYIVNQVGLSGWCSTGDNCYLAGQVGFAPKVKIGNNVKVNAQSGVHSNIPDGAVYFGTPAKEEKESYRIFAALKYLPKLLKRVTMLEKRLNNGY